MQSSSARSASACLHGWWSIKLASRYFRQRRRAQITALVLFAAVWLGASAQDVARHREFSANVLMHMDGEKSGIGARIHVQDDNLYLDYPDLVNHRRVPFWFLGNGVVATVKEGSDEEFNPGPADPLFVGFLLRFRSTNPDRFCEEFRRHYIEMVKAGAGELSDQDLKTFEEPENFPCEQTGQTTVAQRDCRTFRFAGVGVLSEGWTTISFDPKLATILQIQVNPPRGLVIRLDAIKEEPQRASLFVPPPGHVVVTDVKKPGASLR